jgi:selenoprotein W-related protein
LKAEIEKRFPDSQIELIESSGGVFEVNAEGRLLFSKKKLGRFPELEEISSSCNSAQLIPLARTLLILLLLHLLGL